MDILLKVLVFVIGAMFGSAANALIDRLPRNESWFSGRSHCDKCGHTLEIKDLIPIISYLYLTLNPSPRFRRGKRFGAGCRYCGSPIPFRNTWVEIFMGIGALVISYQFSVISYQLILLFGIFWVTTIIAVMDWETKLVSEVMVGLWLLLVIIYQLTFNIWHLNLEFNNLIGLGVGVAVIGGLWAITKGRAMGFGDVEIAMVMGLWLGWPLIVPALWLAFVTGAAAGLWSLVAGRAKMKSEIAFGPFLILGTWVALYFGDKINVWMNLIF